MWRYLIGAGAALLLGLSGILFLRGSAPAAKLLPGPASIGAAGGADTRLPDQAPAATARTREARRFDRYDKDRDGAVTSEEYLANRRKAFAKLDVNQDGKLAFEEWALKATTKFAGADKDKSGTLTPAEFAATAPPPGKGRSRTQCICARPVAPAAPVKDDDES